MDITDLAEKLPLSWRLKLARATGLVMEKVVQNTNKLWPPFIYAPSTAQHLKYKSECPNCQTDFFFKSLKPYPSVHCSQCGWSDRFEMLNVGMSPPQGALLNIIKTVQEGSWKGFPKRPGDYSEHIFEAGEPLQSNSGKEDNLATPNPEGFTVKKEQMVMSTPVGNFAPMRDSFPLLRFDQMTFKKTDIDKAKKKKGKKKSKGKKGKKK